MNYRVKQYTSYDPKKLTNTVFNNERDFYRDYLQKEWITCDPTISHNKLKYAVIKIACPQFDK